MVYKVAMVLTLVAGLLSGSSSTFLTQTETSMLQSTEFAVEEPAYTYEEMGEADWPSEATVDGAAWQEGFIAAWGQSHEVPFSFDNVLEPWMDAYKLSYGTWESALTAELFQLFEDPSTCSAQITLYLDQVPALEVEAYEAMFYDAIKAAYLAYNPKATVGELRTLTEIGQALVEGFDMDGTMDESDWDYLTDDIAIRFQYIAETEALECYLDFVVEEATPQAVAEIAPSVDGEVFAERFVATWSAANDLEAIFEAADFMESMATGGSYGDIARGTVGEFMELRVYQSYEEASEYWFTADFYVDEAPAALENEITEYIYSAIEVAILAHDPDISTETLEAIIARARAVIEAEKTGESAPEGSNSIDNIYVSAYYSEEYDYYSCAICFEV